VRACHPEPTAAVTAVAAILAIASGRTAVGVIAVAIAVLAGQLSVGWSNDYLDQTRDLSHQRTSKPLVAGLVTARVVGIGALVALTVTVPLSLLSGPRAATAHLIAVAAAWAYNLRLKATVLSVLPYAIAFALLPVFVSLGLPGAPTPPWWTIAAGALLGAGAHFVNVIPDIGADLDDGVRGLPQRVGAAACSRWAAGLLLAASVLLVLGNGRVDLVHGTALVLAVILTTAAGARASFRAVLLVAVLDVLLLVSSGGSLG
jgi:4-hydroxybenzoate polyprenyltransferase